jgi:hypothetical protein
VNQPVKPAAFGRATFTNIATTPPPPESHAPVDPEPSEANRLVNILEKAFLWVPCEENPGFPAICLTLVRQIVLPIFVFLAPVIGLAFVSNLQPFAPGYAAPTWWLPIIGPFLFGCFALVEQLGRYGFVRHADRQMRAVSIFSTVPFCLVVMLAHARVFPCVRELAFQIVASIAMLYALRNRNLLPIVIGALVIAQVALNSVFPQHAAASHEIVEKRLDPNIAAKLPQWAKLYPGAALRQSRVLTVFGLTDWQVIFNVRASPDQIGSFYESAATRSGFTDNNGSMMGLHMYKKPGTDDRFTVMVTADPQGGSLVVFDARSSTQPGSKN